MSLATSFVPPYPFPGLPSLSGGSGGGNETSTEALPGEYSLSFVRGDAFSLTFLFVGVCWTPEEPSVAPSVPWQQIWWASEIRDPDNHPVDPCAYYYGWVPIWGGLPPNEYKTWFEMTKVVEFTCTAVFVELPTVGTMVTLSLTSEETILYPGEYRWDLQSATERTEDVDTGVVTLGGVTTWLQGPVMVQEDYTITPEKV